MGGSRFADYFCASFLFLLIAAGVTTSFTKGGETRRKLRAAHFGLPSDGGGMASDGGGMASDLELGLERMHLMGYFDSLQNLQRKENVLGSNNVSKMEGIRGKLDGKMSGLRGKFQGKMSGTTSNIKLGGGRGGLRGDGLINWNGKKRLGGKFGKLGELGNGFRGGLNLPRFEGKRLKIGGKKRGRLFDVLGKRDGKFSEVIGGKHRRENGHGSLKGKVGHVLSRQGSNVRLEERLAGHRRLMNLDDIGVGLDNVLGGKRSGKAGILARSGGKLGGKTLGIKRDNSSIGKNGKVFQRKGKLPCLDLGAAKQFGKRKSKLSVGKVGNRVGRMGSLFSSGFRHKKRIGSVGGGLGSGGGPLGGRSGLLDSRRRIGFGRRRSSVDKETLDSLKSGLSKGLSFAMAQAEKKMKDAAAAAAEGTTTTTGGERRLLGFQEVDEEDAPTTADMKKRSPGLSKRAKKPAKAERKFGGIGRVVGVTGKLHKMINGKRAKNGAGLFAKKRLDGRFAEFGRNVGKGKLAKRFEGIKDGITGLVVKKEAGFEKLFNKRGNRFVPKLRGNRKGLLLTKGTTPEGKITETDAIPYISYEEEEQVLASV
eukprot:GHVS01054838.1.p1 GENE.GHVS01054838.1~~GHVS01054838.1.p1  ORF type:complete len:594 (+),score=127.23 GHVS01054838.1:350-2131(+)